MTRERHCCDGGCNERQGRGWCPRYTQAPVKRPLFADCPRASRVIAVALVIAVVAVLWAIAMPAQAVTVVETESCRWVKKARPPAIKRAAPVAAAVASQPTPTSSRAKPKRRRFFAAEEYEEVCDVESTTFLDKLAPFEPEAITAVAPPTFPEWPHPFPAPIVPGSEPAAFESTDCDCGAAVYWPVPQSGPLVLWEQPAFHPAAPVVEPATWALMAAGLVLLMRRGT